MSATTELMRRTEVMEWLETWGISRAETRTLMEANVIKGAPLRPGGRDYYSRTQIQNDVLPKPSPAAGPASDGAATQHTKAL